MIILEAKFLIILKKTLKTKKQDNDQDGDEEMINNSKARRQQLRKVFNCDKCKFKSESENLFKKAQQKRT